MTERKETRIGHLKVVADIDVVAREDDKKKTVDGAIDMTARVDNIHGGVRVRRGGKYDPTVKAKAYRGRPVLTVRRDSPDKRDIAVFHFEEVNSRRRLGGRLSILTEGFNKLRGVIPHFEVQRDEETPADVVGAGADEDGKAVVDGEIYLNYGESVTVHIGDAVGGYIDVRHN